METEVCRQGASGSLTHEAAVEHPGSHQREREQEEDVVVMVPGTCKRRQPTCQSDGDNDARATSRAARTDAAVDPDGVVVLLRHARVTAEAVLRPYRLLDLRTRRRVAGHCCRKPLREARRSGLTMHDVQKILGLKQPASANINTF